jgi:hypothetical protein
VEIKFDVGAAYCVLIVLIMYFVDRKRMALRFALPGEVLIQYVRVLKGSNERNVTCRERTAFSSDSSSTTWHSYTRFRFSSSHGNCRCTKCLHCVIFDEYVPNQAMWLAFGGLKPHAEDFEVRLCVSSCF